MSHSARIGLQRTSEVELPLFYRVERGGDGLDELGCDLHPVYVSDARRSEVPAGWVVV